jgi:hypothetical protein
MASNERPGNGATEHTTFRIEARRRGSRVWVVVAYGPFNLPMAQIASRDFDANNPEWVSSVVSTRAGQGWK